MHLTKGMFTAWTSQVYDSKGRVHSTEVKVSASILETANKK